MLLNKCKLILFFIQIINQSICVDLNNITREDIDTLEKEYKDMKFVKLMEHPYYIKSRNEDNFCPVPYSHLVDYHDISYEDVYKSHKSEEYKFNEVNTNYRNALLICMELMKDKVHFLKEPKKVTMNELTVNRLKQYQDMSNRVISRHLTLKSGPTYKDITGDLYQTSCTSCKEENTGTTNEIYIWSPCGHGWCCDYCNDKFRRGKLSKCPVCFQKFISTQDLNIRTSVSIVTEKYVPLQARCILDEREARCIKCRSQVTDDDDDELSKSYIMIPCGHGWYCENCIEDEKCSICKHKKTDKLCVQFKKNE
ncbi:uncharacterized protein LOC126908865 isoform X2 [Daktulosphaira vitifoliae]|uniref:uncharacterized protein LOC126908865 isoform X2 n=1 Tax=Daktulosphaira vitifoliae TaxID=58002 RepID=UPI0021A9F389|nr:uncharacterized protein LOC126908865 isoform X2 [Daktulosphaira vitifoliae]